MTACFCGSSTTTTGYLDDFCSQPLLLCQRCGALRVAVEPGDEQLDAYYRKTYSDDRAESLSPEYEQVMVRRARAQVDFVERHASLKGACVLDYGCGYGALLDELSSSGAETSAFDLDPRCIERVARAHRVMPSGDPEDWGETRFDIVFMSHILEHLARPKAVLEGLRLRSEQLFVEVPFYDAGVPEQFDDTEGHLWFFSEQALRSLLESAGWQVQALDRFGPAMNLFWKQNWINRVQRRILQRVTGDWFFDQYTAKTSSGIWIRALAKAS